MSRQKLPASIPSILNDPQYKGSLYQATETMRAKLRTGWRINKNDPGSPLINDELQEVMVNGFLDLVDAQTRVERTETTRIINRACKRKDALSISSKWAKIITGTEAKLLHDKIINTAQLQAYNGDKEEACMGLLGVEVRTPPAHSSISSTVHTSEKRPLSFNKRVKSLGGVTTSRTRGLVISCNRRVSWIQSSFGA